MDNLVKCPLCGSNLRLICETTVKSSTITNVKIETSKMTGKPIVVQVRPIDYEDAKGSYFYTLLCLDCQQVICSSNLLADINNEILKWRDSLVTKEEEE